MSKKLKILAPLLRAFLTDIFMIYVPILYTTTYIVLDGAIEFRENQLAVFIDIMLYGVITSLFFSAKRQTPGYRYANVMLEKNGQNIGFFLSFLRFAVWLTSMGLLFGLVFPFLDSKTRTFHDAICKTQTVHKEHLK